MAQYTVTLSDAENKALGYYAASQEDWINNAVHERCRIAIDEIVKMEVEKKLAAGQTISGSKEDIVNAAELPVATESIPI
jgi:hypothetical protein